MDMPLQLRILQAAYRVTAARPLRYTEAFEIQEDERGAPESYVFRSRLVVGRGDSAIELGAQALIRFSEVSDAVQEMRTDVIEGGWNRARVKMLDALHRSDCPFPPREVPC